MAPDTEPALAGCAVAFSGRGLPPCSQMIGGCPSLERALILPTLLCPPRLDGLHHECLGASSNSRVVWCHSFLFLFNARLPPVPKPNPGRSSGDQKICVTPHTPQPVTFTLGLSPSLT